MKLMRQIESDVKREWDAVKSTSKDNLAFEDCEPNLLKGWTDKNPSVWDISGEKNKPSLKSILFALSRLLKSDWKEIAYLIFPQNSIDKAKGSLVSKNGNTSDQRINVSNTHYELKNITGKQLCSLIYYIINDEFETGLFKKSEYNKMVDEYVEASNKYTSLINSENSTTQTPFVESPVSGSVGIKREAEKPAESAQIKEVTKTIASSSTTN